MNIKQKHLRSPRNLPQNNKFCFRCVNDVHSASECDKDIQCTSPDCQNPRQHNTLLHGASRIVPWPQKSVLTHRSRSFQLALLSRAVVSLPVVMSQRILTQFVSILSCCGSAEVSALCNTGSVHYWVSDRLAKTLFLTSPPANVALSGILSNQKVKTEQVEVVVLPLHADPLFSFDLKPFTKPLLLVGKELIEISEQQMQHLYIAPIPPIIYNYSDIQLIIGQDAFFAIHLIDAFEGDPENNPWDVQLPLGWSSCGATPGRTSASFVSTCFKATVEDLSLAEQVKAW